MGAQWGSESRRLSFWVESKMLGDGKGVGGVRVNLGMKQYSESLSQGVCSPSCPSFPCSSQNAGASMKACGQSLHHKSRVVQDTCPCPLPALSFCLWSSLYLIHAAGTPLKVIPLLFRTLPYLDSPEGDAPSSAGHSHTWGLGAPASKLPSLTSQTCLSDWALGSGTFNFRGCKIIVGSQRDLPNKQTGA